MNRLLEQMYPLNIYISAPDRIRARFLYALLTIVFSVVSVLIMLIPLTIEDASLRFYVVPIIVAAVLLYNYFLVRRGEVYRASWIVVVTVFLGTSQNAFFLDELPLTSVLNLGLLIVMVGFLVGERGLLYIAPAAILVTWLAPALPGSDAGNVVFNRISTTISYTMLTAIIFAYNRFAAASRQEGEEIAGEERFKLAEINTAIALMGTERASLKETLDRTLALILENYPQLYHAQVFLLDKENVQARLTASTGETGQRLIEKGHSLAVGSLSVIGQTTFKGEAVIARAGDRADVHRENVLLPETRVEAAFPMRVSGNIIGALDLQSRQDLRLSDYDIQTFQSLANSLSLAVDNIQQFEEAQQRIVENQRLAEQTRSALRDVERLNQRLIGRAWSDYAAGRGQDLGLTLDFEADTVTRHADWTTGLMLAMRDGTLIREQDVVSIPLNVRGQVIGAMEFELHDGQSLSVEDIELIQEISERFGLAAENLRLLEDSQRTAQRETLINEITSRFQTTQNVETTLTEAARSISETLRAERVRIRLGSPAANGSDNGKES